MPRVIWNAPEGRFFDTGLDRGMIYPKKVKDEVIIEENLLPNPSAESPLGWIGSYTTNTRTTSQKYAGTQSLMGVVDSNSEVSPYIIFMERIGEDVGQTGNLAPMSVSVESEKSYSASIWAKCAVANSKILFQTLFYDVNETLIEKYETTKNLSSDEWINAKVKNMAAPANAVLAQLRASIYKEGSNASVGDVGYLDSAMFVNASDHGDYFDGDSQSDVYSFGWLGTPHSSRSVKKQKETSAAPWNGLISVDEEGGEEATSYYIDGRPFLFLPRPKEYKASLSAYTYPDIFSSMMGISEIADGLFLDSQMGDAFDMSYRTLVGNGVDGTAHGHKIHLIYNATVTPQSKSYETMGSSINPVAFSWEIQAVPKPIEGFRPTAHIIIDTRNMSQSKIDQIENILYGSETSLPRIPDPQELFDMLNFGDRILVIDNGDGTFTVEGSYENVYMIGPGIFRVDNVDGQDNGDGTFTISTTV